jgi:ATP-binding cassette subfamily C protein CydD
VTSDAPHSALDLPAQDAARLRRAAWLQVAADLVWPVQALCIASVIGGWAAGATAQAPIWIAGFVAAGLARAGLNTLSGQWLFALAEDVVTRHRAALLERESRLLGPRMASAELAALHSDKIPLLAPCLMRYRPAMLRVRLVPVAFLGVVFPLSWIAALVLLVAGPLIPVFMALVGMAAKDASTRQMAEIGDMNRLLIDRIAALPDARLLGGLARSRAAFADSAERLRARTMAVLRIAFLSSTVLELFAAIGVAMVAVYVGFSLLGEIGIGAWATPLTITEGVFILLIAPEFFQPLRDLAAAWHDKAAAESVADELATLEQRPATAILGRGERADPLPGPATIRVQKARLHRGAQVIALPDINLEPGESLALVGPSGAGKTSMIEALAGLLPLDEGMIDVAGVPLDDRNADAWRARVGLVPQVVHLPDLPLRRFLDPHDTGADPRPALQQAQADRIVAALPEGLETRLGEGGAGVSGGEARRLMLARALLSGADVILADEPTADLDPETGARIIAALRDAARRGHTVIAATHDPALAAAMGRYADVGGGPA